MISSTNLLDQKFVKKFIDTMLHLVKIYDICIGYTQCVHFCPTDLLKIIPWNGCKVKKITSTPRTGLSRA